MSDHMQYIAVIGMLALLFGAYFGALALAGWYDKKEHEKRGETPRFDERQRIVRLRAGNHALYTLVIFLILWTVLDRFELDWMGNTWSMLFCALFLTWGVWAADCVLHDGLVGWKEQNSASNTFAATYSVMMLSWSNMLRQFTGSWLPPAFACVDALVLSGIVLYKYWREKREEKEEEVL